MRWSKRKVVGHEQLVGNEGVPESGKHAVVGKRDVSHKAADALDCRTGDNRIRDSGRRARRDSDSGDHGVSSEAAGIVERHSGWHQRALSALASEDGQATVEFAVIAAGFMAVTVALTLMWRAFGGGLLVEHALAVASHHIQAVAPVTIVDIFLY